VSDEEVSKGELTVPFSLASASFQYHVLAYIRCTQ
jgi:hypothetical protein